MSSVVAVGWSEKVEEADWIKEGLSGKPGSTVASVVPAGFEAYARILHPARRVDGGNEVAVRWSEVAAWSGMPLERESRFHSVALPPEHSAGGAAPWNAAPCRGALDADATAHLAGVLRANTADPENCWFAVWDGHGWVNNGSGAVPSHVVEGPRATFPARNYILYAGAVEAGGSLLDAAHQTPNLWWPADRSWVVATETDLQWTYVAGSESVIGDLEKSDIEILRVDPDDKLWRIEGWVARWVYLAVTELLRTGDARVATSRGNVVAWFERPSLTPGALEVTSQAEGGSRSSSRVRIEHRVEGELRQRLSTYLTLHILNLVEG